MKCNPGTLLDSAVNDIYGHNNINAIYRFFNFFIQVFRQK